MNDDGSEDWLWYGTSIMGWVGAVHDNQHRWFGEDYDMTAEAGWRLSSGNHTVFWALQAMMFLDGSVGGKISVVESMGVTIGLSSKNGYDPVENHISWDADCYDLLPLLSAQSPYYPYERR